MVEIKNPHYDSTKLASGNVGGFDVEVRLFDDKKVVRVVFDQTQVDKLQSLVGPEFTDKSTLNVENTIRESMLETVGKSKFLQAAREAMAQDHNQTDVSPMLDFFKAAAQTAVMQAKSKHGEHIDRAMKSQDGPEISQNQQGI